MSIIICLGWAPVPRPVHWRCPYLPLKYVALLNCFLLRIYTTNKENTLCLFMQLSTMHTGTLTQNLIEQCKRLLFHNLVPFHSLDICRRRWLIKLVIPLAVFLITLFTCVKLCMFDFFFGSHKLFFIFLRTVTLPEFLLLLSNATF